MKQNFYTVFADVPYPCFWMGEDGTFWSNPAASPDGTPFIDMDIVQDTLTRYLRKKSKTSESQALPGDALRTGRLLLLPLEDGVFAALQNGGEAPISTFSAELREPLTNIFAVMPLLAKKLEDEDLVYAETVQNNCYNLLRLASNLETAGRIEQQAYKKQCVDLNALVDSLCFCASSVCKERGVQIARLLPPNPILVEGDAALLGEAVLNLLRNSLLFTRDDNQIKVKLYETAGKAVLTVEDKGMGIKAEHVESIFMPYYSVDPYGDGERPGLGLGLAVAQRAIAAMGGTITAESNFGEGTRITFALPLADGADDNVLASDPADYLLNRYSPIYVQLSGLCRLPAV